MIKDKKLGLEMPEKKEEEITPEKIQRDMEKRGW
jgi:hypothetical protein